MLQAKSKPAAAPRSGVIAASVGVVAILLVGLVYWAWTATPQLAADEEVYASLDALFTAVTAHRQPLVVECEGRLAVLHHDGKIPEPAWKKITHVIGSAKLGNWESAAEQLYTFIEHQKQTR